MRRPRPRKPPLVRLAGLCPPRSQNAQGHFDRLEQLGLLDRLQQIGRDPQPLAFPHVVGAIAGREHHDHRAVGAVILPDLPGQHEAVDVGHVGVGNHQRERLTGMFGLPQEFDGLRGAGDAGGQHLPTGKHLVENSPVRGVVVHHQHAHAVQAPWLGIGALVPGSAVRPTQTNGEMEAAAAADLALDPDPPAHQADQAGGDGQAQPGPAMPPGGRAVGLLEHAEDGRVFFRRECRSPYR